MVLEDHNVLTVDVGGRLRQLRTERGQSLRALARASGLSTNALSMIERGRTSPSVSTLYKLAEALEVPITAFFRPEPPRKEIVFCRRAERRRVPIHHGVWEGLGGEEFTERMEPFIITLEPGAGSGPFGMLHSGSEFALCLRGRVEYEVENQVFTLEAGDSLLFAAQRRHRWRNPGSEPAELVIVLAGFQQSERPSEYHLFSGRRNAVVAPEEALLDEAEEMDLDDQLER